MFSVEMRYQEDGTTVVLREEQTYPVEGYAGCCLIRGPEEVTFRDVELRQEDDVYILDLQDAQDDSGMGRSPLGALIRAGWEEE